MHSIVLYVYAFYALLHEAMLLHAVVAIVNLRGEHSNRRHASTDQQILACFVAWSSQEDTHAGKGACCYQLQFSKSHAAQLLGMARSVPFKLDAYFAVKAQPSLGLVGSLGL